MKSNLKKMMVVIITICMLSSMLQNMALATEEDSVTITVGIEGDFATLEAAITETNNADSAIIKIISDVTVTSDIYVTSDITIVGAEGTHTVTMEKNIWVQNGGKLTLGDGDNANFLTFNGHIEVTNGVINVNDGVAIKRGLSLKGLSATGAISGGHIEGDTALTLGQGAKISEISGGVFTGRVDAVLLSDAGTKIDKISGGYFYERGDPERFHGHVVFVQNEAQIGEISGGYFDAEVNCALVVTRGAWIDTISGGVFVAQRVGVSPYYNSVVHVEYDTEGGKFTGPTGIGIISGGHFSGAYFGILVISRNRPSGAQIDEITGGTFLGTYAGLQNDADCVITKISGGKFATTGTGTSYGIMNVGRIGTIGGNVEVVGRDVGIWNYYGSQITEISGGIIQSSGAYVFGTGISNAGTIDLISGGTIIGDYNAISNTGSNPGNLKVISGGVFWAKSYSYTITLSQGNTLRLEPGLSANMGVGRYWSGQTSRAIFNNEALVEYPHGYSMSIVSQTTPVEGITGVEFRYLTLPESRYEFHITYELGGGVNGVGNPDSYVVGALPCIIADPSWDGHTFEGWLVEFVNGPAIGPVFDYSIPIGSTGDVTLVAQWAEVVYTVSVEGSFAGDSSGAGNYVEGAVVTICAGSNAGYVFTGWTVILGEVVLENSLNPITTFVMPGEDVVLTAKWAALEYRVHYYLFASEFSIAPDKIVTLADGNVGDLVTELPIEIDGYSIVDPRPLTITLNSVDNVFVFYYLAVPVSTTWYTINYYLEGTVEPLAQSRVVVGEIGSEVTVEAIGIGGYVALEPTVLMGTLNVTGNVFNFFYKPIVPVETEYRVHYYLEGTTISVLADKVVGGLIVGDSVTESAITIAGYTAVEPTSVTIILAVTDNVITFYYTANTYTVTYAPGAQGTFASQVYSNLVYGATTPGFVGSVTGNSGYTFNGWSPAVASTVTGSVTYTAQWSSTGGSGGGSGGSGGSGGGVSVFTVRFVDWDGELLKLQRVRAGNDAVAPADPSREGYIFDDWDQGFTNVQSDLTVTAKYTLVEVLPPAPPEEEPTWALANLILSITGIILAIILTLLVLLWRNQKQKQKQQQEQVNTQRGSSKNVSSQPPYATNNNTTVDGDGKVAKYWKRCMFCFALSVVLGIVGLIVFVLTEDMSLPMRYVDNWTIINAIIFIVEIVVIILAFKYKKQTTQKQQTTPPQPNNTPPTPNTP